MHFQSPPKITMSGEIKLFGAKGTEIYKVKSIYVYDCKIINDRCVHDISIEYCDGRFVYFFILQNIPYEELEDKNYLSWIKKSNLKLIQLSELPNCKFLN